MLADGFGQIAIAVGIAGHQLAQQRQHLERISVVQRAQRRHSHLRELEHDQLAAGLEHALHRGQRRGFVGDVAQSKADGDAVKAGIGKGQALGVGLGGTCVARQAFVQQPVASVAQHGGVDIGQHHQALRAHLRRHAGGQVTRATGDI